MSILALVFTVLGFGFLALVWAAVLMSVARIAWRGAIRAG